MNQADYHTVLARLAQIQETTVSELVLLARHTRAEAGRQEAIHWLGRALTDLYDARSLAGITAELLVKAVEAEQPMWYAMHAHPDLAGRHQHFPENTGHGSHDDVPMVPYDPNG